MKLQTLTLKDPISLPKEPYEAKPVYTEQRVALAQYRNLILTAISEAKMSGFHATEKALIELLTEVQRDLIRLQERDDRTVVIKPLSHENKSDG